MQNLYLEYLEYEEFSKLSNKKANNQYKIRPFELTFYNRDTFQFMSTCRDFQQHCVNKVQDKNTKTANTSDLKLKMTDHANLWQEYRAAVTQRV